MSGYKVPNVFPMSTLPGPRIAVVGEAPGREEAAHLRPFVGHSGRLLDQMLSKAGILRAACYIGNVYQYFPPGHIDNVDRSSAAWQESVAQLRQDLARFQPTVIIALGNTALTELTGKHGILKWRGSILPCLYLPGCKVIPSIHPAFILRIFKMKRLGDFDFARAKEETETPTIDYKQRRFIINPGFAEAINYVKAIEGAGKISVDIETNKRGYLLCIGIGASDSESMSVPMDDRWSVTEYLELLRAFEHLLGGTDGKIFHNAIFDVLVLAYRYNLLTKNIWMDTMIGHHACFMEMRKSLALITSLYTKEPYYKDEAEEEDDGEKEKVWADKFINDPEMKNKLYNYNCKDVCVTYECATVIDKNIDKLKARRGYDMDMANLEMAIYMSFRGILIDPVSALADYNQLGPRIKEMADECRAIIGYDVNVKSPTQMKKLLYDDLKLPPIYEDGKLTTNAEALISLTKKTDNPVVRKLLKIRQLRTHEAFFFIKDSKLNPEIVHTDGRLHAAWKVGGTEVARWSGSKCFLGGRNPMNIPNGEKPPFVDCRRHWIADPGHLFIGWDKSGADANVVAYKSYICTGDSSYMDLIKSGQKVHAWLGRILAEERIFKCRPEDVIPGSHEWFISKKSVHGFSYGEGPIKFGNVIAKETEGEIIVPASQARAIKEIVFTKLPAIPKWQQVIQTYLQSTRRMENAFGRVRFFFERWGDDLFGEAYAFEPASTVADDVCRSMHDIYETVEGFEMLHNNFDSMFGQMAESAITDGVLRRIKTLGEQPITIWAFNGPAQVTFTIPVVLKVGKNWSEMEEVKL